MRIWYGLLQVHPVYIAASILLIIHEYHQSACPRSRKPSLPSVFLGASAVVQLRYCRNHVRWLQQMPFGLRLLRTGPNGDRVDVIRCEIKLLKRAEHV